MAAKVTRAKIIRAIPYSFGILQNIADDLKVTRTAVSRFLSKPENLDLKEEIAEEEKRIFDYAKMNITQNLLTGDMETAKWFLATFGSSSPAKYSPKKNDWKNQGMVTFERNPIQLRRGFYHRLAFIDSKRVEPDIKFLPGRRALVDSE